MNAGGWLIMLLSLAIVLTATIASYWRLLSAPRPRNDEE